jgi:simple sugar transport system ATP-binding protein
MAARFWVLPEFPAWTEGTAGAIAGLQNCQKAAAALSFIPTKGRRKQLSGMHPIDIKRLGVALAFVPEDRLGMGLVGSMDSRIT